LEFFFSYYIKTNNDVTLFIIVYFVQMMLDVATEHWGIMVERVEMYDKT